MALRHLPAVHSVATAAQPAAPAAPPALLTSLARSVLAECREAVQAGAAAPSLDVIVGRVLARLDELFRPSLRPVINASGVIIQTNLGRAPLSAAALAAIRAAGAGYSNLEYDLESGERSSRSVHLSDQLTRLTGAEAALAVNNAAAALLLVLSGLAAGREVLVSRGQAVEIGGGFRIPDVLRQSGCRLVDVGTTNRTYAADYAAALTPDSAAILRVHSSNFRLTGFVHEPALAELAAISRSAGIALVDDLGSGALVDTAQFGLAPEPTVRQSLEAGADIVVFSGDKLLGGPQAGIILGRRALLQHLARHPLLRALRVDKTTIAALSATLAAYERGSALSEIPIWRMISTPLDSLRERAERIADGLDQATVVPSESTVGGGSLPGSTLPSLALAFDPEHPDALAARLRRGDPPLVARINAGRVLVDLRSVLPEEDAAVARVLRDALGQPD